MLDSFAGDNVWIHVLYVLISVGVLWKAADWFVEGAVGIAYTLRVPPMLVGIVLVSLATTAPELMASMLAALQGMPEVALGNAVGSVLVDASIALGIAALVASTPLVAHPRVLRTSAIFLLLVIFLSFFMAINGTLNRLEGAVLVALYISYAIYGYRDVRKQQHEAVDVASIVPGVDVDDMKPPEAMKPGQIVLLFALGLAGVIIGSQFLLEGATGIADFFRVPPVVAGLTVVAIGTSTPEIVTVVTSARKGHSDVGVGNVVGADILNICWVAGLSATANPLSAPKAVLWVMFPAMLIVVVTMLAMLRKNYRLVRWNGAVLVSLYVVFCIVILVMSAKGIIEAPVLH